MELEAADRAWFKAHDLAGALAILDQLISRAPNNTAALNFAGWLRTSQNVDFERGVNELKAALAGEDHRPAVNLAEALGAHGRAEEAVQLIRPWCEAHPHAQFAWNSLGWLLGVVLDDEQAGLAALARHPWNADAQFNAGRIHLKARRIDDAEDCLSRAQGCFRAHQAWLHLGEIHATRGHLRRALSAWRRAAVLDKAGEYGEALQRGITTVGNALLQQRKYFPHADEEELSPSPGATGASLADIAALAREVRPTLSGELATECAAIEKCAHAAALLPEFSDQSLSTRLAKAGSEAAVGLADEWRAAQQLLYEELLDLEEPSARAEPTLRALRSALARRQWGAAFEVLARIDRRAEHGLEGLANGAELLGDRLRCIGDPAQADRAWAISEDAFSEFASYATAGGEGLVRMVDVRRLRSKRNLELR